MDTPSLDYLSSLFCGVNAAQNPSFLWHEGLPAAADGWEARQARAAADCGDIERALALLMGELAGLAVDSGIFRGELPPDVENGFLLRITGIAPAREARLAAISAACRGRHADRAFLLSAAALLAGKLPLAAALTVSGRTIATPVTFLSLALTRPATFTCGNDGGAAKAFCEIDLAAELIF